MTLQKGGLPIAINDPLWLGSASPRRLELLAQIGVIADSITPADIDESPKRGELPTVYVKRMALEKQAIIRTRVSKAEKPYILTADTIVAVGRRILPKAEHEADARACLALLSGRAHRVYTAVGLWHGERVLLKKAQSRVRFKCLNGREIDDYIASQDWHGKAGGYAIQGLGSAFICNLQGSYSNVVGLPLYETANMLKAAGYSF